MKKLLLPFLTLTLALFVFSCNNEPLEDFDLDLDNQSNVLCQQAIDFTVSAGAAFNNDTTNANLCNAYVAALQNQIVACGDTNGSLQSIIDGLGDCIQSNQTTILLKKISYSQNPNNNIEFFYNTDNQLTKIQGIDGSSKRWTYINGMVDRAQFYDVSGNLSGDSEEKYIYVNGVITERRDSYNLDTTPVLDERYEYEFNSDGRLVESLYFGTNETEFSIKYIYTYNNDGNLTNYLKDYTNPAINDISVVISDYDDKNYFMKNINPRIVLMDDFRNDSNNNPGISSNYSYNSDNFPITLTNANGDVTTYEYY